MNKTKILFLLPILLYSCVSKDEPNDYEKVLGGKHELRKFNVKTTTTQYTSGWYFICVGGYSSYKSEETKIRFYFKNCKDEYQFMERRLSEVNVRIDSTVIIPYVKFYWNENNRDESEWSRMYEYDVTKAVVYCKESDFQPEININDLK